MVRDNFAVKSVYIYCLIKWYFLINGSTFCSQLSTLESRQDTICLICTTILNYISTFRTKWFATRQHWNRRIFGFDIVVIIDDFGRWELPSYWAFRLANFGCAVAALLTYCQNGRGSLIGVKLHPRSPPQTLRDGLVQRIFSVWWKSITVHNSLCNWLQCWPLDDIVIL